MIDMFYLFKVQVTDVFLFGFFINNQIKIYIFQFIKEIQKELSFLIQNHIKLFIEGID